MSTHPSQAAQSGTLTHTLTLDLEEAATGKVESICVPRLEICEACGGTGQSWRSDDGTCATCNNRGSFKTEKVFEVRVPAGVENGSRLRLAGEGNPVAQHMGRGDLYVTINVRRHERFDRQGRILRTFVRVTEEELAKGTEVIVPTLLDGQKLLRVPPGTPSGTVFRMAGLGMCALQSDQRGDLMVRVGIQYQSRYEAPGASFTTVPSSPVGEFFRRHFKGVALGAVILLAAGFFVIKNQSTSNSSSANVRPTSTPFPTVSPTASYSPTPTPKPYVPPVVPASGTNITPPQGPRGDNSITLINDGDSDIAVKVVSSASKKTRRFVYVRANSTAVIKNLAREVCLLRWESGTDWDVETRRFRYYRVLNQFDESFDLRKIRFTIKFTPSILGDLHKSQIDESDFEDK